MYGIYANIWGILMVNVTIYGIHGSYGYYPWEICLPEVAYCGLKGQHGFPWQSRPPSVAFVVWLYQPNLVGGLEHFIFPLILGISSSQLTNSYFSEGWPNHQPEIVGILAYFLALNMGIKKWLCRVLSLTGMTAIATVGECSCHKKSNIQHPEKWHRA